MSSSDSPILLKQEEVEAPFWHGGMWAKPELASPAPQEFLMMFKADLTVKVNKILNDLEIVGYHKNICPTYFLKSEVMS